MISTDQFVDETIEEEVLNQSKKEMAKMQEIIEDPDRLELIVKDIIKICNGGVWYSHTL